MGNLNATTAAILNAQASSIEARLTNVDNTITSQKRIIALNDSYSKRTAAYTKMVLLTVFVLTIAIFLKSLAEVISTPAFHTLMSHCWTNLNSDFRSALTEPLC